MFGFGGGGKSSSSGFSGFGGFGGSGSLMRNMVTYGLMGDICDNGKIDFSSGFGTGALVGAAVHSTHQMMHNLSGGHNYDDNHSSNNNTYKRSNLLQSRNIPAQSKSHTIHTIQPKQSRINYSRKVGRTEIKPKQKSRLPSNRKNGSKLRKKLYERSYEEFKLQCDAINNDISNSNHKNIIDRIPIIIILENSMELHGKPMKYNDVTYKQYVLHWATFSTDPNQFSIKYSIRTVEDLRNSKFLEPNDLKNIKTMETYLIHVTQMLKQKLIWKHQSNIYDRLSTWSIIRSSEFIGIDISSFVDECARIENETPVYPDFAYLKNKNLILLQKSIDKKNTSYRITRDESLNFICEVIYNIKQICGKKYSQENLNENNVRILIANMLRKFPTAYNVNTECKRLSDIIAENIRFSKCGMGKIKYVKNGYQNVEQRIKKHTINIESYYSQINDLIKKNKDCYISN